MDAVENAAVHANGFVGNHQAYPWQNSRPGGAVVFDFRLGRGREGPKQFRGKYGGILQTVGYVPCEKVGTLRTGPCAILDALQTALCQCSEVESPRRSGHTHGGEDQRSVCHRCGSSRARFESRSSPGFTRQQAPAVLEATKTAVEAARASALPGSTLGKACAYALRQWPKLIRFSDYPELELSTNLAENSIRPIAVGRKNWIHEGSPQAGPKVAAILSIFETCRRIKLPVREYLSTVLPGLAYLQLQRLPDLTPTAWGGPH